MHLFRKYRGLTLILFALLAGSIWRFEVEHYGWHGLTWISYFHLALPMSIVLFILWANLSLKLSLLKRLGLTLVAFVLAVVSLWLFQASLNAVYSRTIWISGPLGEHYSLFLSWCRNYLIPLLPIFTALIARLFGLNCKMMSVLLSVILMTISPNIAIYLLDVFNEKGSSDYIHAIKGGYLMVLWFFSLGVTFSGVDEPIEEPSGQIDDGLIDSMSE